MIGITLLLIVGKIVSFILLFVGAFIFLYYKWSFQYWKKKGICFLEPSIPFGNLSKSAAGKISRMEELGIIYKTLRKQGRRHCGIYQFAAPTYFVVDLDLIKTICIKDFDHFSDRGIYYNPKHDPIGCHIVAAEGEWWSRIRTKTSTCFTTARLKDMFDLVSECLQSLVNKIDDLIENNELPVDNKQLCACFTTDAVGSCTLGIRCRSFKDPEKNFIRYGRRVLEFDKWGQMRFLFGQLFPNIARKLGVRQIPKDVSDFFYRVIWETVISRRKTDMARKDVLQVLMKMNEIPDNGITKDDVIANSFILYIGGFDTSSSTLNYCLFELSTHQEYQEKARKEVLEVLAKHNNQLTYESINDMKYLRQCFDETLRLYAPIHVVNRVCTKDWKAPGSDLVVEKGTSVLISLTSIHRDPEYWERPEEFYPDHHNEENKAKRHPCAFLPFGEGKRRCVGERFGKMLLAGGLATILRRYNVLLDERTEVPLKFVPGPMVPVPRGGIWLRYEKLEDTI